MIPVELYPNIFKFTNVHTIQAVPCLDKHSERNYQAKNTIELYLNQKYFNFTTDELFSTAKVREITVDIKSFDGKKTLVTREIKFKAKTDYERAFIRAKGFNLDEVVSFEHGFILFTDGSIWHNKETISKSKKYVAIICKPSLCIGLTVNGFVYDVVRSKQIRHLEKIVHINFVDSELLAITEDDKIKLVTINNSF